jgi:hypothetical protein
MRTSRPAVPTRVRKKPSIDCPWPLHFATAHHTHGSACFYRYGVRRVYRRQLGRTRNYFRVLFVRKAEQTYWETWKSSERVDQSAAKRPDKAVVVVVVFGLTSCERVSRLVPFATVWIISGWRINMRVLSRTFGPAKPEQTIEEDEKLVTRSLPVLKSTCATGMAHIQIRATKIRMCNRRFEAKPQGKRDTSREFAYAMPFSLQIASRNCRSSAGELRLISEMQIFLRLMTCG